MWDAWSFFKLLDLDKGAQRSVNRSPQFAILPAIETTVCSLKLCVVPSRAKHPGARLAHQGSRSEQEGMLPRSQGFRFRFRDVLKRKTADILLDGVRRVAKQRATRFSWSHVGQFGQYSCPRMNGAIDAICGWTKSCTTLKPLFVGIYSGIIILGFLGWCRISSIHSMGRKLKIPCQQPGLHPSFAAGGAVEIEEFFKGCMRLRGQARGVDVGKLLHAPWPQSPKIKPDMT